MDDFLENNFYPSINKNLNLKHFFRNFLNEISNRILKSKKYSQYTDLATFAFWCRKKNVEALSAMYTDSNLIIGRGCVLHICPQMCQ